MSRSGDEVAKRESRGRRERSSSASPSAASSSADNDKARHSKSKASRDEPHPHSPPPKKYREVCRNSPPRRRSRSPEEKREERHGKDERERRQRDHRDKDREGRDRRDDRRERREPRDDHEHRRGGGRDDRRDRPSHYRTRDDVSRRPEREWDRGKRPGRSPVPRPMDENERFGLSKGKSEVKEEVEEKESVIMKGRKDQKQQKWGTAEMWEEEERKKAEKDAPPQEKEKVNMGTSGALAEDTNMFKGVVIKYNEPTDAKKPNIRWRLYPFKGEEALQVLYIHRQSAYLIGRDRKIADLPVDHPSCSKQHAVLQYRSVGFQKEDGSRARRIRPYIIDLGSANGTFVNNKRVDAQRYYELKEKDVLKFGFSSREFVLLTENAVDNEERAAAESSEGEGEDSDDSDQ